LRPLPGFNRGRKQDRPQPLSRSVPGGSAVGGSVGTSRTTILSR